MFPNLKLDSVYFSDTGRFVENFFIPVLKNAVTYDRVSAYFSARALASYAEGLEFFAKAGHCIRLIISHDVNEEDYLEIKKGYRIKSSLTQEMVDSLKQDLSLKEEKCISNLAYLISLGVIDIKIAFRKKGILHDKCGILTDSEGNKICFHGSNNETEAAITQNYEAFSIICSWLDCSGFYSQGIKNCELEFEKLWNNKKEGLVVLPAQETIMKEILKHNKGKVVVEENILAENALVLDYDDGLKLWLNVQDADWLLNGFTYKLYLKKKVKLFQNGVISFNDDLSYIDFIEVENRIRCAKIPPGISFCTTQRYRDYIEEKNLHIEERRKLGTELKTGSNRFEKQFEEFSKVVDERMVRKLRTKQLRDAFFMLAMQKSGNFSVPGSGKTTSVLAVYCYLKEKGLVDKILVIGPKNCFKSWRDEFVACFAEKEKLSAFDIQYTKTSKSPTEIKNYLRYNASCFNELLFNYEILASYERELIEIAKSKTLLVFDEVHRVKRVNGEYAAHALNIAKESNYTIALTGTPIPNTYKDLYNFLHILFPNEYRNFFNFSVPLLANPSAQEIDVINKKIQPFFCRTTKQQLKVPPPNADILKMCRVHEAEQSLFEVLCKKYRTNKLALLIRVLQLETNPKLLLEKLDMSEFSDVLDITENIDDIGYRDYSDEVRACIDSIDITSKKKLCINTIKSLVEINKTVIVWCIFQDSIKSIFEELNKVGISSGIVYGHVEHQDREKVINDFRSGRFNVLITNPHTLAESISLHDVCHDAVYYEYSYNLVHLLQSKDRIHRLGLPDNQYTQYFYLQSWFTKDGAQFSLDNSIYNRLNEKEQIMINAIDNNVLEKVTTPEEDVDLIFKDLFF